MVGNGKNIIWFGITGDPPGVLITSFRAIAPDMLRIFVCICVDNDIVKAQIPAGIHDADGNFASVGDKYLSFHTNPLTIKFDPCSVRAYDTRISGILQ